MTTIDTISDLLNASNSQYRIYDIGRKIDKISKETFEKIEHHQLPYPYPSQGHAFIAIAFWQKSSTQPYLWFVKLPLDERGLINQGARNHFIAIIVEALGSDLTVDPTEQQEELLKANPYHFTPAQYKLASLNSLLRKSFDQSTSQYYQTCLDYLSGELGWDNWQNVGVQGLSDFAVNLDSTTHQKILVTAIKHVPIEVLIPLSCALENTSLNIDAIDAIVSRFKQAQTIEEKQALLRALASSSEHPHVINLIQEVITQPSVAEELFIVIAGRNWLALQQANHMMQYLEHLVNHNNQALFEAIFKDLVTIPTLRMTVFSCMRSEQRSQGLAKAIGSLFAGS